MITHRAADECLSGRDVVTSIASTTDTMHVALPRSDSAPSLGTLDDELAGQTCCTKSIRSVITFAILVWLGHIAFGRIEKDFNDMVADSVPKIQQHFEQFSESNYWNLLNESMKMGHIMQERQRPGFQLAKEGAAGKYPVVMIPGFITSGLEIWAGKECARNYFRQRLWGGVNSARLLLMERDCILQHLALDPRTGMDPEGIRLRAAQGFEAADYFMANYWVWGKILENFADIGYDGSRMSMESYDWRLAFPLLEERDGYLTKLKHRIEAFHKASGKKVVLTSHSLGGILVHYFFAWVTTSEKDGGGGGGKTWVDEHIHAYVNIAGAHLGVPKAAPALLSGEFRDTIFMGTAGTVVEQFLGRKVRRDLWNTWGSLWSMLPKGGDAMWGIGADFVNKDSPSTNGLPHHLPDENTPFEGSDDKKVPLLVMTGDIEKPTTKEPLTHEDLIQSKTEASTEKALEDFSSRNLHSTSETIDFLLKWGGGLGSDLSSPKHHSFDQRSKSSSQTWHDVSRTPLPYAPNMKIYCLYGVGLESERAYYYKRNKEGEAHAEPANNDSLPRPPHRDPSFVLDTSVNDPHRNVEYGVKTVDGDGSVPLISLGYMCADAWQREDSGLNPSGIEVITREYKHRHEFSVDDPMRMGPYSADHVDILGNINVMEDLMKIVTDHNIEDLDNLLVSDIKSISKRINEHPEGGLYKQKRRFSDFIAKSGRVLREATILNQ